jgi:arsenate-mycothiol transferase
MPDRAPHVVFVCARNGGKSQLAAALMRHDAGDAVTVASAGTDPGSSLNALAVESRGAGGGRPKPLTDDMVRAADLVVVLGAEAHVDGDQGVAVETWITDEPSERGIDGMERMRLVRDDIRARVDELRGRLVGGGGASAEG